MKNAYPVILTKGEKFVIVYVPDFDINTQGTDIADAMEMARDAIGLIGIDMEDDGEALPTPTAIEDLKGDNAIITLVDVDFADYRRRNEMRSVKKNCTIPSWLNYIAEQQHVNFSETLQKALMAQLNVSR